MTGITTAVRGPSAVRPKVAAGEAASNKRNSSLLGALVLLAAVQLMVVLDTTIVNVALPSIQRGLGFSISGIAWVVARAADDSGKEFANPRAVRGWSAGAAPEFARVPTRAV